MRATGYFRFKLYPFFIYLFIFYFLSLLSLFTVSDFFIFWSIIELAMLFFIGVCYRTFTVGFSSLIVYFLIQTVASFSLFIFYVLNCVPLLLLSFFLKLSMFPFHSWFLSVVYRFSNISFFISLTFHKFPSFLILSLFFLTPLSTMLLLSCVLTVFLSSSVILSSSDLRLLLLASSIGNNAWFLFSRVISSTLFTFFMLTYSFVLLILISFLNIGSSFITTHTQTTHAFSFCVLVLSGLPPSPLFIFKLFVVSYLVFFLPSAFIFIFLVRSSLILAGYIRIVLAYISISFSSSLFF